MPTSALKSAIAASNQAAAAARVLKRIADRYDSGEFTVAEMQAAASESTCSLLYAAEKMRRAIIDFEVAKSETRLRGQSSD
jgi:hypothetical protein